MRPRVSVANNKDHEYGGSEEWQVQIRSIESDQAAIVYRVRSP
jgi:hypothetical protein